MRYLFFLSVAFVLMCISTACQDELIATAEDMEKNAYVETYSEPQNNDTTRNVKSDEWNDNDSTKQYPIGFTVIIKDYDETDIDVSVDI